MKALLRNRGLVERGGSFRNGGGGGGVFQIDETIFLQKSMFSLLLDFFCLVNITLVVINISVLCFFENKSQVFESDYTITVHNDIYYNELKI